jgi:uncharacterized protein YbjT (DUF2867 family)
MFLITGATGLVGRALIDHLLHAGEKVRAISREPAAAGLPAGVEVVGGDPRRPDTITPHLDGVTAVFLNPRAVGAAAPGLLASARTHGVRRVVALAASNVDTDPAEQPSRLRGDLNREVEQASVASGLEWASLRPDVFAVNALYTWGTQIRAGDVVAGPYPDFAEAPIHEQDLAAVAAHALRTDDLLGQRTLLTGPAILTQRERVAEIGRVLDRPLRYVEIAPETAGEFLVGQGAPEAFVTALFARMASAPPAVISDAVPRILGRPARTFTDWVSENAADFGGQQ